MTIDRFDELVGLLYDAALDARAQPVLLDALQRATHAQTADVIIGSCVRGSTSASIGYPRPLQKQDLCAWQSFVVAQPGHRRNVEQLMRDGAVTFRLSDLADDATLRRSSFYAETLRPLDTHDALILTAAEAPSQGDGAVVEICLTNPRRRGPLGPHVHDVLDRLAPHARRAAAIASRLADAAACKWHDEESLRDRFGLTAAEARLADTIIAGATISTAAADLRISPNTVKTQLRAVFLKTGTRNQTELVRLLSRPPASIAG